MTVALIDDVLPVWDVRTRHSIEVSASAERVWRALHEADLAGTPWVRALLLLRALPGRLRLPRSRPAEAFDQPGYAKVVWSFRLEATGDGRTQLWTETRVRCLDPDSERRFRRYWRVGGPFSGLIRLAMLRAVKREAERTHHA